MKNKTTRQQIVQQLEELAFNPDDFDEEKIADWAIEIVKADHEITQQLIDEAVKKTIKGCGEWLAARPYAFTSKSGCLDRRVTVQEISVMKIKGELPK